MVTSRKGRSLAVANAKADLLEIRKNLQIMLTSAAVVTAPDDSITHYVVHTGALHRILGIFAARGESIPLPSLHPEYWCGHKEADKKPAKRK